VDKDLITTEELRKQDPEKHFQGVLEVSEFEWLRTLVEDSNKTIYWDKLVEEWVVKIKNKRIEWIYYQWDLELSWTSLKSLWKLQRIDWYLECGGLEMLEDLWELEEVEWDAYFSGTGLKSLWKLKRVNWYLYCKDMPQLEDLWDLEKVWWNLNLIRINIKSLWKLKQVRLTLSCNDMHKLEDIWELEEVWWDFDLKWVSIDLQCQIVDKIKNKELKVGGGIYFWWELEWIEKLLEYEEFPGDLYLQWTKIKSLWKTKKVDWTLYCQNIKTLEDVWELEEISWNLFLSGTRIKSLWKIKKINWHLYCVGMDELEDLWDLEEVWWCLDLRWVNIKSYIKIISHLEKSRLKVGELILDKGVKNIYNKLYKRWKIDFDEAQKIFGDDINKIEDEKIKSLAKTILLNEYERVKEEVKEKWKKIIEENKGKKLSDEQKKALRTHMKALDRELVVTRDKIESFGIQTEDL